MKNNIRLYSFGRYLANKPWKMDIPSHIVTRLYYVNSGTAIVSYSKKEYTLTEGNVYLLPQCPDFRTLFAQNFDHTFFDFRAPFTLKLDSFVEIPGEQCNLKDFFVFINKAVQAGTISLAAAKQFVTAMLTYMDQNFHIPYLSDTHIINSMEMIFNASSVPSVKALAQQLNLNENYFIRLFTNAVGVTPMKYIRSTRLSEGKQMLKNGISVTEVSEYCGYTSPTAFWKAFQKEFGCAPSHIKSHPKELYHSDNKKIDRTLYHIIDIYNKTTSE